MNERIADCIAILRIREKLGDNQSKYHIGVGTLQEAMFKVGFLDISIRARFANIKHCYANYGLVQTFIMGALRDRGLL